jgi:cell division septal protein FtsQ
VIAKRIETKLPYIEDVKVKKRLPTTVDLNITAAKTAGYIEAEGKFLIISSEGKILEIAKKKPKLATIDGIVVTEPKEAQYIKDEKNSIEYVKKIYSLLGEGMSSGVTEVDVSDSINLSFVYKDRITVKLGSEANLKEKLKVVVLLLTSPEEIHEDDVGIVYASNPKRVSFLKKGSYSEMQQQLKEEQEKLEAENNQNTSSDGSDSLQNVPDSSAENQNGTSSEGI